MVYLAKYSPRYIQHPPGTTHSYYNTVNCVPYAVLYLPVTILQLPVIHLNPFIFLTPLPAPPPPPPSSGNHQFSVYEPVSMLFVHLLCFSFSSLLLHLHPSFVQTQPPGNHSPQLCAGHAFPFSIISFLVLTTG